MRFPEYPRVICRSVRFWPLPNPEIGIPSTHGTSGRLSDAASARLRAATAVECDRAGDGKHTVVDPAHHGF
ncbi:hypothetical protein GCM10023166_21700 [Paeniglutamicibacter cryotolerans]